MNWDRVYKCIIENATNRKGAGYEKHNGVKLTPKEHFICHLISQKNSIQAKKEYQIISAFNKLTARSYERYKTESSKTYYSWYNNGEFNIKVKKNDIAPIGFTPGLIRIKPLNKDIKVIESNSNRSKKIIEINSGEIFVSIKAASGKTGLSVYHINQSLKRKIPIDNYIFSYYYKGVDYETVKSEYLISAKIPYKKIREVFSKKVYKDEIETEKYTGVPKLFIRKSIRQQIPVGDYLFELID